MAEERNEQPEAESTEETTEHKEALSPEDQARLAQARKDGLSPDAQWQILVQGKRARRKKR